jgi:GR25 family glycosyltransferase involved in LPS biosynthesis
MKTFIINVSTNEQRRAHMLNQISKNECLNDYFFIHDGDIDAITPAILNKYFGGQLSENGPMVSCAYKHFLACKFIIENNLEFALVLEDDIYLYKGFCNKLHSIIAEIENRHLNNYMVSLEDSTLEYVKHSDLEKNTLLYKRPRIRTAGAYLIDKAGAQSLIQELNANKCNLPVDWFHNHCSSKGLIDIYWSHPVLAIQGSLNGKVRSMIDKKKTGRLRVLTFRISRFYKKVLYRFR